MLAPVTPTYAQIEAGRYRGAGSSTLRILNAPRHYIAPFLLYLVVELTHLVGVSNVVLSGGRAERPGACVGDLLSVPVIPRGAARVVYGPPTAILSPYHIVA